ncbi:PD-(D/E)XK nuclease family protein [Cyclobacteriaceae bacterium]|nr:PD-(D/E)XK nuclease family protein [Cyclobacteriaceae bacterium]
MEKEELKSHYDKLLKDEDFDKLDLGLKNPNIFQILRITKNEIRHSNFLSWLLNPHESHKLGDIFLKRFLREVFSSDKFLEIDQVDVEGMDLTKVEIQREWKNIDILIILKNVVVCIENKVLSKEHSNQLNRYKGIIESHYPNHNQTFVFLTPEGDSSESESETYEPISYEFIVNSLERIISVYGESLNEQVKNYIKDYITIIKRELMGTDKLTELSKKIYQNHKELFNFIIDHKPDVLDSIKTIFERQIEKRGWILGSQGKNYLRFTTPKISELTYINENSNGWRNKESFLFEFDLSPVNNRMSTKIVISPSDSNYNTNRLSEMLVEIEGFTQPSGKKWLVNYHKLEDFPFSKIDDLSEEEIESVFNKILDTFSLIVEKVENKFLEYRNELSKMKNI